MGAGLTQRGGIDTCTQCETYQTQIKQMKKENNELVKDKAIL